MELLTKEKARKILEHPFINFAKVAEAFYGKKGKRQALRFRTLDKEGEWSQKTLERLTVIFAELHHLMQDGGEQVL